MSVSTLWACDAAKGWQDMVGEQYLMLYESRWRVSTRCATQLEAKEAV